MIRKIAICAVLVLVLVPAIALAAGQQGQGAGTAQGKGIQAKQQVSSQGQCNEPCQMLQNRVCDQNCEMYRYMIRNQSQGDTASITGQPSLSATIDRQQDRIGNMSGTQIRGRAMNRTHLQDGSCGNCPNS